jgi:hypothetical protein
MKKQKKLHFDSNEEKKTMNKAYTGSLLLLKSTWPNFDNFMPLTLTLTKCQTFPVAVRMAN